MTKLIPLDAAIGALEDRRNQYRQDSQTWLQIQMDVQTILAIPIATQPAVVTVKPLVWEETSPDTFLADSQFGMYARWDGHYRPAGIYGGGIASPDPAAAAQADYEARILSSLNIQPADPAAIREAALKEAVKSLRDWQVSLNSHGYPDTALNVGMAADVVETMIGEKK